MVSSTATMLALALVAGLAGAQAARAGVNAPAFAAPDLRLAPGGDRTASAPAIDSAFRLQFVQSVVFGQRCVTRVGSCAIAPQPVGSPCQCGSANGTTYQ